MNALVSLAQLEADHIRRVVASCDRMKEAASILGIKVETLREKRRKLGLPLCRRGPRKEVRS